MQSILFKQLENLEHPIDVIVVGLGFMSFGFFSASYDIPGIRVPVVISRDPERSKKMLEEKGFSARVIQNTGEIQQNIKDGVVSLTDDFAVIEKFDNKVVIEMTGTIEYGKKIALATLKANKHFVTMNPELQATLGSDLLKKFQEKNLIITDVLGDQPGSLTRLIASAQLKGFTVRLAGNMKRYLDRHATQEKMKPWADDKGLAVRQTVSFTDGTKQSIEMTLVGNYYGMKILQTGMVGPEVDDIRQVLTKFDWKNLPPEGIVDYVIGKNLFPGVFVVVEHPDPNQQVYLRYLGLGDGPQYVLFDSYHLCHLEVAETIAKVVLYNTATINNGLSPHLETVAYAKRDLEAGEVLDGIGGDMVYGQIQTQSTEHAFLPVGFAEGSTLKAGVKKDEPLFADQIISSSGAEKNLLD